jgi:hypothetical protein
MDYGEMNLILIHNLLLDGYTESTSLIEQEAYQLRYLHLKLLNNLEKLIDGILADIEHP